MASEKKVINQEDFANNKTETNPKGAKNQSEGSKDYGSSYQ